MSVVKINVLTVEPDNRAEFEARFAARRHAMDTTPGFEGFEVLRPTGDSNDYFVVTRFDTEENFAAWAAHSHPRQQGSAVSASRNILSFQKVDLEAVAGER